MLVTTIIERLQEHLSDADAVYGPERWTTPLLEWYIGIALSAISLFQPDATAVVSPLRLNAGKRQDITGGSHVLDVRPEDGGFFRVVKSKDRRAFPFAVECPPTKWSPPDAFTITIDDSDKGGFFVSPAAKGGETVLVVAMMPPVIVDGVIPLSDTYEAPLIEYVLYMAFDLEQESTAGLAKSQQHRANFLNLMQVDVATQFRLEAEEKSLRTGGQG